jgi:hypothetical protein
MIVAGIILIVLAWRRKKPDKQTANR